MNAAPRGSGWLAAGLVALASLGSPALALASCPPLPSRASRMEAAVSFQETVTRLTAREGRVPDSELWDLFERGVITLPPVVLDPPSGPAPLTVETRWLWHPVEKPVSVELDADGDGRADASDREYGPLQHTYTSPGRFRATASVRDRQGRLRAHATEITVMSPSAFDAELQARWDGLKGALGAGDVDAALECLHSMSRDKYREVFRKLFAGTARTRVDDVMTSISFVEQRRGRAIYEMLRQRDGTTYSYQVEFVIDVDDVWRLRSF